MITNIIISALICCFFFYILNSPIGVVLKNWVKKYKSRNIGLKLEILKKIEYVLNCCFCFSFWIMIPISFLYWNNMIFCLTTPFASLLLWQAYKLLKKTQNNL